MATYQVKLVEKASQATQVVELVKGKNVVNTPNKHNIIVVEKATGKTAKALQMKRKGKDLLVELDDGTSVEFIDYYSSEDVVFLGETNGSLTAYDVPTLETVVKTQPVTTSGSSMSMGKVLAGVGLALGGIAGLAGAGGGGKSGGSGDSTPNTNTNNTPQNNTNAKVENIKANSSVDEGQTLTATVTLDNTNGNPNLAFKLAGLEADDYSKLTFSHGVTRNNDGSLNIPKNVKTFTVSLDIVADKKTEGEESLTFTVGDQSTIVKVADTSVTPPPPADAKVVSVTAGEKVNEGQTLTATVTLDNQNGNSNLAFKLDGLETADYNNLVFSNGVTRNSNGTLNILKNVKTFTVSLNIIADNTTEGEQSLTLTVGDKPVVVKVADTSVTPPPPANAKVEKVDANSSVDEGQTLTATVTLDNTNGNPNLAFKLTGLEADDYSKLTFSNGVTRNNDGSLNIPKNVKTFTVSLDIVADKKTEGEESLTLTVGDKPAVVKVADTSVTPPPPANAKVEKVDANSSVDEGQTLTATVTLDNTNGNPNLAFELAGLETNDYSKLTFGNGVTHNTNGTLNIPKNVKTFTVSLDIVADKQTEGEQTLTLTVGDKSAVVKVEDTSTTPVVTPPPADAKVVSVTAGEKVNEGQTLTATVTLDNQNGNPNLAFKLEGLETNDYSKLTFSNDVTRNNDGSLNIPKNVKTFTVSLNIVADKQTEGVQSLNLTVGDKSAVVKVEDTSITPPPPADAKVASVTAGEKVNEGQTLTATVTLDNQNGNSNLAFKLDGLETADYNNLIFSNGVTRNSNGTLNIPKNVKTFTVSLNIVADKQTEGVQSLNLTVGDKSAVVKVEDTSTTPVVTPPPADAKVASITAGEKVNEGQTLTATVTLDNQNGNPNLAFNLAGLETADYNNLVFSNGVTRNSNGTLNIPKNVKTFIVSLNIIADNTTEGEQSLNLTVGDKPAVVKVVDTSVTPPPPANAKVASIKADSSVNEGQTLTATVTLDNQNGHPNLAFKLDGLETADYNNLVFSNGVTRNSNGTLNIPKNVKTFNVSLNIIADNTTEGEQSLNLTVGDKSAVVKVEDTSTTPVVTPPPADAKVASVIASEKVNEGQTLTATVTLDNQNGNSNLAFKLDGLETADYNNLVFSNGVTRNSSGTLNIPKNVKTFNVSLNIIADNTTEGEQSLNLTVGDKSAVVKVEDTSITPPPPADAKVTSVTASEKVNEGQTLTATVTLDNQNGNPNLAFNLAGLETADYNNLVFSNGVTRNNDGTLNIPKNVKTFTVSLNIIADNTTEGEQSLNLTVGDKSAVVKVEDTSITPPPPADAKVASVTAGEKVNEGQTLTATVTLDNQNGHPNLAFNLAGLETADYNNLVFSHGVTRNSNGTLNIPKNVKTFTVSLNIVADKQTEGEQSLNLTVGDKSAVVKVEDTSTTPVVTPPPADAKVASVTAGEKVNEGQTLTATVTLDNQNGNSNLAFKLDGLETADYNNLVFSNGVTRNNDGTLNIPKNVKTFNVSLNIIADNITEGEQSLTLTVGDKPAIVKVVDTSVTPPPPADAKVVSVTASEKVNEGQTLTATVTLDNQNGNPNLAFKLDGLETADYNNLVFSNGVTRNSNGTLNIPKNVKTFNVSLNIIADNTTEGEESLTLTVGDKPAVVKVADTSVTPPPPANAKVEKVDVNSNIDEGQTLTATVTLDNTNGNPNLAFKLTGLEADDYSKLTFSNGVTRNNDGSLNIPKNVKTFTVSLDIVADKQTEGEESLTLTVGDKVAIVTVADTSVTPPPSPAKNQAPTAVTLLNQKALKEKEVRGAVVGDLKTTDADDTVHTYTVSDNRFEVVNNQLKLKQGVMLDYSKESKIALTVTSTDKAGLWKEEKFNIAVTQVTEHSGSYFANSSPTTSGNDTITSTSRSEILEGGAGNDTYVFRKGDGHDRIQDWDEDKKGEFNTIKFTDVNLNNISHISRTVEDTGIGINIHYGEGDLIELTEYNSQHELSKVQFADGTSMTVAELMAKVPVYVVGTSGNNTKVDTLADDIIVGGKGNDTLNGWYKGNDTYIFNKGDGKDIIHEKDKMNKIVFNDVESSSISFSHAKDNVTIHYGNGDQVSFSVNAITEIKFQDTTWSGKELKEKLHVPYWVEALMYNFQTSKLYADKDGNGEVYYAFPTKNLNKELSDGWSAFTTAQKDMAHKIFEKLSTILNVEFKPKEITQAEDDVIYLQNTRLPEKVAGLGGLDNRGGNVWMAKPDIDAGTEHTMAHEIGHALGLSHPQRYPNDKEKAEDRRHSLTNDEDKGFWTIMSYDHDDRLTDYQPMDIAALQYLYGVNPTARAGNEDKYFFNASKGEFVWDGAGNNDTIDASSATADVYLNLNAGTHSYIGQKASITQGNQLTINHGTVIETAIGGNGNDTLIGNDANNILMGGNGNDSLNGGAGNDVLLAGEGNDTLIGGKGNDSLVGGAGSDTFGFSYFINDATGGHGHDTVKDFQLGNILQDAEADKIDLSGLLVGYTGDKSATSFNGYLSVTQQNGNTVVSIDRDGSGTAFTQADLVTLEKVQTTLAELLANQQIII